MTADCYVRYPHVCGELVTFVAENDVWLGSTGVPPESYFAALA